MIDDILTDLKQAAQGIGSLVSETNNAIRSATSLSDLLATEHDSFAALTDAFVKSRELIDSVARRDHDAEFAFSPNGLVGRLRLNELIQQISSAPAQIQNPFRLTPFNSPEIFVANGGPSCSWIGPDQIGVRCGFILECCDLKKVVQLEFTVGLGLGSGVPVGFLASRAHVRGVGTGEVSFLEQLEDWINSELEKRLENLSPIIPDLSAVGINTPIKPICAITGPNICLLASMVDAQKSPLPLIPQIGFYDAIFKIRMSVVADEIKRQMARIARARMPPDADLDGIEGPYIDGKTDPVNDFGGDMRFNINASGSWFIISESVQAPAILYFEPLGNSQLLLKVVANYPTAVRRVWFHVVIDWSGPETVYTRVINLGADVQNLDYVITKEALYLKVIYRWHS